MPLKGLKKLPFICATYPLDVPKSVVRVTSDVMSAHDLTMEVPESVQEQERVLCRGSHLDFYVLAWPINPPAACSFPPFTSATIFGFSAMSLHTVSEDHPRQRQQCPYSLRLRQPACRFQEQQQIFPCPGLCQSHLFHPANDISYSSRLDREIVICSRSSLSMRKTSCCIQLLATFPSPTFVARSSKYVTSSGP